MNECSRDALTAENDEVVDPTGSLQMSRGGGSTSQTVSALGLGEKKRLSRVPERVFTASEGLINHKFSKSGSGFEGPSATFISSHRTGVVH